METIMADLLEYRVRPVTRYVVTRFCRVGDGQHLSTEGEYEDGHCANRVAYALCKAEHDRLGYPPGDERIQYPRMLEFGPPSGASDIGNPISRTAGQHDSDCATHNAPALPPGPCDCRAPMT